MKACVTCRHWSELVAEAKRDLLTALCENPEGPKARRMTAEGDTCPAWEAA